MEKGVTTLCGLLGEWRMKDATPGEKQDASGETLSENSPFFTPGGKELGFPFSENGPFSIHGEGATSPFSNLREREERDVTTPIGE